MGSTRTALPNRDKVLLTRSRLVVEGLSPVKSIDAIARFPTLHEGNRSYRLSVTLFEPPRAIGHANPEEDEVVNPFERGWHHLFHLIGRQTMECLSPQILVLEFLISTLDEDASPRRIRIDLINLETDERLFSHHIDLATSCAGTVQTSVSKHIGNRDNVRSVIRRTGESTNPVSSKCCLDFVS
jgi:hypothetical protein